MDHIARHCVAIENHALKIKRLVLYSTSAHTSTKTDGATQALHSQGVPELSQLPETSRVENSYVAMKLKSSSHPFTEVMETGNKPQGE